MKKLFCFVLAFSLLFGMSSTLALGANDKDTDAYNAADALYALGLFQGTGTDANGNPIYELDRAPTRNEAVTMLVRLLGKDAEAKAGTWDIPFNDVVAWVRPYVGYAYAHGLTSGTSASTFSGADTITATQYITFVLRALGYDSSKDFKWNAAWELSDKIGLTSGEYGPANNASFLRGDVAIISHDVLYTCSKGTSVPLIDTIPLPETDKPEPDISYTIDYSGKIPVATGGRNLDDMQLNALNGKTPEQAASSISTLADAYAWLKQEGYSTTGMSCINGPENGILNGTQNKDASWMEMSTILNVLLEGDYDEVGTYLCATMPMEDGWAYFFITFNYVKVDGVYYVTDPICHLNNSGWACCRAYTIEASSLTAVKTALEEVNADFMPITLAAFPLNIENVTVKFNADPLHVTFPSLNGIQYLFQANAEDFEDYEKEEKEKREDEMKHWQETARSINISNFNIPSPIGRRNLNYDDALALVGQDPQVIAKNVKSVSDVLQYMIAARFGYYSDFFGTPWYDFWGFDAPGDYQIRENYGCCCGGYANAVSFLLQGDYEKVGTLRWVGGGNHTISWVYTEGKYYVFDFTQYCSGGYYNNYNCPVTILDRLEDFYDQMPDTYSYFPKSEVVIMVAFEAGDAMYPSNWQDPPNFTGLTLPKEAEGKVTVIYQKYPQYGVKFRELDVAIPGWNE